MRHGRFGDPEHRIDVRPESRIKLLSRDIDDRPLHGLGSGIIDQNIKPAQLPDGVSDEPVRQPSDRYHRDCNRLAPTGRISSTTSRRPRLLNRKVIRLRRQPPPGQRRWRAAQANAGITTDEKRLSTYQPARAPVAFFAMIWPRFHLAHKAWRLPCVCGGKGGRR